MKRFARAVLVGAASLLGALPAHAQVSPFWISRAMENLTEADVDMIFDAAQRLNTTEGVRVGDKRSWSNPETKAAGTVAVTKLFKSAGLSCHAIRYEVSSAPGRPLRTYQGGWCKTVAGEWKIKD